MASHPPGVHTEKFRHRITEIKLEPSTSNYNINLKILVDGQEAHRLQPIRRGAPLLWNRMIPCDVHSGSIVELRIYERHFLAAKRVGIVSYDVSEVWGQPEVRFESETGQFTAILSFPTTEADIKARANAIAEAQALEKQTKLLKRLGPTRDALKKILDFSGALSELHPGAKAAFGMCKIAWQILEGQEQYDDSVEKLVVQLAGMLPPFYSVKWAVKSSQLQKPLASMMDLIEDASRFVIEYKSGGGPLQSLRAVAGSNVQDQVQNLLEMFRSFSEEFDLGVDVQALEADEAVHEVLLTNAQRALLNELKPVGSARYDPARTCLPGTRTDVIQMIVDWAQRQGSSERLLWIRGPAGFGKTSIASSVCQNLEGKNLLASEFFCKRDSSERRDLQQVLKTIVYGLALRHSEYAKSVVNTIQRDSQLYNSPIQMQYDNLVKVPLAALSQAPLSTNLVIVVDALDECGTDESRRQLLAYLHVMSQLVPWLKVILTSRPDADIQSFFYERATSEVFTLDLYDHDASNDISTFIHQSILSSHISKELPLDATRLLTEHAKGLFIWAKTACELIGRSHEPKLLFDQVVGEGKLDRTSSPLDSLYTTTIETSLGANGSDNTQYVQEYLGAIIICSTRTPLSVSSLSDLLGDHMKASVLQFVVDSLSAVLYTDHAQGGVVRVYQRSFTDYMTTPARSKQFCINLEQQNANFARCCLRTMLGGLKFNICELETSHIPNSRVPDLNTRVETAIRPHLRYSCLYWTSHLTESKGLEPENLLRELLLQPSVLYWIEALSLLGRLDVAIYSALELSKQYQASEPCQLYGWDDSNCYVVTLLQGFNDIYQSAKDIYRFVLAFYDPISASTPHLYVSALAFCPARTTFIRRLQATFQNTLIITSDAKKDWSPWLRCMSHPASIAAIAVSNDGRRIVTGSMDNKVRVWDADTGAALGSPLEGHSGTVWSVGFSPDGRRIVSSSSDATVRVWDADTGAALGSPLEGHSGTVWSVGFSPDGRRIVSSSSDATVRVWDADTGAALGSPLEGHSDYVISVGFSPDGRRIVSGSSDKTVRVWDADTGAPLGNPLEGHSGWVNSVVFSSSGRYIVSGSDDRTVRVWDAYTGAALGSPLVGHSDHVRSVAFSPDDRRIASGSSDKTVRVWDIDTGAALGDPLVGHSDYVMSVRFSPDGHHIVSGSLDQTVRVWDGDTDTAPENPLIGHSGTVCSVGFSPDGRRIVSGSSDKTVRVWDADTGAALGSPLEGHSGTVMSVGFSPDGRRIVSGSSDKTVRVWDTDTGAALGSPLEGHSDYVMSVGFSPDGRRIVSGSSDKTVRVWDADTGAPLGNPLRGHTDYVRSVGFSPDGRRIVSSSDDATVRVWDADTGAALGSPLEGHSGYVMSVGFSPDGRRIVSGSSDKTVRVWDADTGAPLGNPLEGHSGWVNSVVFSSSGRYIVSGSDDRTVRVWDAYTGAALGSPLEGHSDDVMSVGFSPDGRRVVSGSSDATVRVWDPAPPRSLNLPKNTSRMNGNLSSDGWLRDMNTDELLIWLPEEYRRHGVDDSSLVISERPVPRPVTVDFSKFVHGSDWGTIYTPHIL